MTAKEMMTVIGKTGTYSPQMGIYFDVVITDVRKVFNRVDYLIEPVQGMGNDMAGIGCGCDDYPLIWEPKEKEEGHDNSDSNT